MKRWLRWFNRDTRCPVGRCLLSRGHDGGCYPTCDMDAIKGADVVATAEAFLTGRRCLAERGGRPCLLPPHRGGHLFARTRTGGLP